jgi:tetratricopeptide (TPR) repeat protein
VSYSRLSVLFIIAALLAACSRKESGPPPKYAFIGFENLSGDASLDWAARGAGDFLASSLSDAMRTAGGEKSPVLSSDAIARAGQPLGAHPANAPASSAARDSAVAAGAGRIVSGYVERVPAGVRITASEEDTGSHETILTLSATAPSPFEALRLLARDFSAQAGPPGTSNADAFRLYSTALGLPASQAVPLLGQAVQLDPDFGRAWVLLTRTWVVLGDRTRAEDVITQARTHKTPAIDQAWLSFESAALGNDRSASLAAMSKVADLDPSDGVLARSLADADTAAGRFADAATVWKRLTKDSPADVNVWNQLGYTLSWSGNYAGALAAIAEYARLRPDDANPLDSRGDIQYWFGKYADAAASYASAYAKTPGFLNGGDLYKEAWADFLAGDKTAADTSMDHFRNIREKAKDPTIDLLAASWLYRTGRTKEAMDLLHERPDSDAPAVSPIVHAETVAQLAVWDLLAGDRARAAKDVTAGGATGLTSNDLLVRFAALPSASVAEWESRAAHIPPQLAALRNAALGYALILDGKKPAAIPVWEEIVKQSGGADFFAGTILARLKGTPVDHAVVPDPSNPNPFSVLTDKL